jgi:4,5-DOPA dioxygenase extradiol
MDRITFLKFMAMLPVAGVAMKLNELNKLTEPMGRTEKMPVLFLGHGSPMNAIEENEFVTGFRNIASEIPRPNAILCISAHWETRGTFVTAMDNPPTIHDFGGFPKELFAVQYPAPGSPQLARETQALISKTQVGLDDKWGLDHGAWSVIKHLYPKADIPVIQMSLDYSQTPQYHYELAQQIQSLRKKGVLIIGSGNIVHNLRMVEWQRLNDTFGYDWAIEANEKMKSFILNGNHKEHYLPLLYTLALQGKQEPVKLFNDKAVAGSLTMTSVKIG